MCRVLIVDDDEVRVSRIQRITESVVPGCVVVPITSFRDAEAWLDGHPEERLDLAIVDLFLKGGPPDDPGEGSGLTLRIRNQFSDCPCILISGFEPLSVLRQRLPHETRLVRFVSLHYTAQSMWGQLRESIADALAAQAAAAGNLH